MNNLSPIGWALRPVKKYATFSGRAPRAELWWFLLFLTASYVIFTFAFAGGLAGVAASADPSAGIGAMGVGAIVLTVLWLALLLPMIAVQVRRLHDLDRSGWWIGAYYLIYLIYMVVAFGMAASAGEGAEVPDLSMFGAIAAVGIIFLIYSIVLLVFFCMRGTQGPNRFGPDPYEAQDLDEVFA